MTGHVLDDKTQPVEKVETRMSSESPTFQVQVRGFNRAQVIDYILGIHGEIESLQERIHQLQRDASDAETDRERLTDEITALRGDVERLSGPIDSVEGMSDRIARMMRVASDEARLTKAMAREEADTLTRELREQVELARQERAAAGAALTELQASAVARREEILAEAKAEAEEVLQTAYNERACLAEEAEEADRRRRETQRQLAEEDERRRRDTQRRLDQQIKSSWEQAEAQIAAYEKETRLKVAGLLSSAEREAESVKTRAEGQVKELLKVRGDVLSALGEIQSRVETAIRRDKLSIVKSPPVSDEAGEA
jgi:cell division septum initiation protein DivIVA